MSNLAVNGANVANVRQAQNVGEQVKQERMYGTPSFTGEDAFVSSQKKEKRKSIAKLIIGVVGLVLAAKYIKKKGGIKNILNNIKNFFGKKAPTTEKSVVSRARQIVEEATIKPKKGVKEYINSSLGIGHKPKSAKASAAVFERLMPKA